MISGPAPRSGHGVGIRILVVSAVAILLAGYAVLAFLTKDLWLGTTVRDDQTRVVFDATAPDGNRAPTGDVDRARDVVEKRLYELGANDIDVSVDDSSLVVSAHGPTLSAVEQVGITGQMSIRPVIHVIPAEGSGATTPAPPGSSPSVSPPTASPPADSSQRIADDKALRQSEDQNIQVLALQFEATRCGDDDVLAGQDDPSLPLVTCSQDGTAAYVLAPSIIDGSEIEGAAMRFDDRYGEYVVDVEFDSEGARTWAEFTAANVGTQTAFTLDTSVVSAPEIREAIPGGAVQITGAFTEDSAAELVGVLESGALPVTLDVESSSTETGTTTRASTVVRVGMGVGGLLLILLVVGTVVYLVTARRPTGRATT